MLEFKFSNKDKRYNKLNNSVNTDIEPYSSSARRRQTNPSNYKIPEIKPKYKTKEISDNPNF